MLRQDAEMYRGYRLSSVRGDRKGGSPEQQQTERGHLKFSKERLQLVGNMEREETAEKRNRTEMCDKQGRQMCTKLGAKLFTEEKLRGENRVKVPFIPAVVMRTS